MVTRYDDVQFVLKRTDIFSSAAYHDSFKPDWLSEECKRELFLVSDDPPAHTKRRDLVSRIFLPRTINEMRLVMRDTAKSLLSKIHYLQTVDFVEAFSYPYASEVISSITGIGDKKQSIEEVRAWIAISENITPTKPDDDFIKKLEAAIIKQNNYFDKVIEDRRLNPGNDLVTALIHSVEGDQNTIREALHVLLESSYYTIANLLSNSMIFLSQNPELMTLLSEQPKLIPNFIEEILRLYSPAPVLLRKTTTDVELSGTRIPADSLTLIILASANRDPAIFDNPDHFDIHRDNIHAHMAFGHGVHICLGMALARAEVCIALEEITRTFNTVECPPRDELPWLETFMLHAVSGLPTTFFDKKGSYPQMTDGVSEIAIN